MDTSSEEWRMECEARYVANLNGIVARRGYLELVEGKRGVTARKALEAAVAIEWMKLKNNGGGG